MTKWRLGILGGMGPLATVDFMRKLLTATTACSDQEQLPVVAWNVPQIPDRQKALAGEGESPLAAMRQGLQVLNDAGTSKIIIPCNTAHYWYGDLATRSEVPILNLINLTVDAIAKLPEVPAVAGLIATRGTLETQLYQQRLKVLGIRAVEPTEEELASFFVPGCYAVKQGKLREGGHFLSALAECLVARGASFLILACTEVPIALESVGRRYAWPSIDPSDVAAAYCAKDWHCYLKMQAQQQRHREEVR